LRHRARYVATRDPLTDLPNRDALGEHLARAIADVPEGFHVAVLFIDLDRFKAVNNAFGRAFGDRLLKEVAERLRHCVAAPGLVARVSGDEFVLVPSAISRIEDAAAIARCVLSELHTGFDLEGQRVYCTASAGIAVHPGDGTSAAELVQNADIAMARAKRSGRNTFQFFLPEMQQLEARRLKLETALRRALERDEFLLLYQPRVSLPSGSVCGFEALLRWRHPELGILSPAEFIPILEETGLIVRVGEWAVRTVCRQIRSWESRGLRPRPIAVNLSARQFRQSNLDVIIARIIAEVGIDPALLELELTESSLMHDPDDAVRMMRQLESYGVRLAVDDFGTGYSSLAYLKRFPLDALKIDRGFVRDATHDPADAAITISIIQLAHNLGLRVVAEGVETAAQRDFLLANGCTEMQGYLFSPPIPADATDAWVKDPQRDQ
jgi:diguanylate cyclase (GGDEF)-like protein